MSPVRERDTAALSLFADEMKAAREQRGWSQADLADQIPYSLSTISMVEALHRVPTRDLAVHLDKAFGTPGTFTRLEGRLRDLPFPASFRPFAAYETEATALYVFEHSLIPGLLQTPDYARAVLATRPNTAEDEIDNLVTARLARQAILTRDDPPAPLLWALIDEGVSAPSGRPGRGHARSAQVPGGGVAAAEHHHPGGALQRGRPYRAARRVRRSLILRLPWVPCT